nr:hypothetical protein GCM10020092_049000 [Actinoplanes digitatis]
MQEALDDAEAAGDRQVALMVVDLNGFKAVNDTMGHHAGDRVLVESGRRLAAGVGGDGVVARLGGDEFAVLLPRVTGAAAATELAEVLVAALRRDFVLDEGPAAISGSLGIALGPMHGTGDELFRHADAAMYRAKGNGGGVAVYDSAADAETPDRMQLFADLRALLETGDPGGQLRLYYQPQVRLSDGAVTSVEALVRWQHPARGLLMPGTFLPIAESSGLEVRLTYHLLGVAVRQAAGWLCDGRRHSVSVNVSPGCLIDPGFVARVLSTVDEAGLPPKLLRLELTETSIMADPDRAVRALHEVREHGVSVSVDDFGTGFSSLAQLRRVPSRRAEDRPHLRPRPDDGHTGRGDGPQRDRPGPQPRPVRCRRGRRGRAGPAAAARDELRLRAGLRAEPRGARRRAPAGLRAGTAGRHGGYRAARLARLTSPAKRAPRPAAVRRRRRSARRWRRRTGRCRRRWCPARS